MEKIVVVGIVSVALVLLGLTVLIVANKAWRDRRQRTLRRRREILEPLVAAYVDGNQPTLIEALGGAPHGLDRQVLEAILLDRIPISLGKHRQRLTKAAEEQGFVDHHIDRLAHHDWWRRADAAERLGRLGAGRVTPYLTRAMEDDEDGEVRLRAARALGSIGGSSAAQTLIRALGEPNRWSTIRIADIVTSMGPDVLNELTARFPEMNLHAQLAALDILAALGDVRAAPWLREQLQHDEKDVRARAAHALGSIGDMDSGRALTAALSDSQWPVRAMAAKALGTILHLPAISELCRVLRDREWWVRTNSAEALRLMGPEGLDALDGMLDDFDPYARHQAVLMLEESGIIDQEIGRLVDDVPERRAAALSLVNRLIHAGLHGRLRELAGNHPNTEVRELLSDLLPEQSRAREATP